MHLYRMHQGLARSNVRFMLAGTTLTRAWKSREADCAVRLAALQVRHAGGEPSGPLPCPLRTPRHHCGCMGVDVWTCDMHMCDSAGARLLAGQPVLDCPGLVVVVVVASLSGAVPFLSALAFSSN